MFVILAAALGWSGYWVVGVQGVKSGFANWFGARQAQGWAAEYADLAVRGFPNRFDTTFTDLSLADPATGWAWEAPFFQILALSYKPNHVIAIWPDQQLLATPGDKYDITSAKMQASLVLDAGIDLPLNRSNLAADTVQVAAREGGTTTMTALRVAVQRVESTKHTYRMAVTADDLAPPLDFRTRIDAQGALPRTLAALRADLTVSFDRQWDRSAIEQSRPQPTALTLKLAEARWGELELLAAGELEIDTQGRPMGRLTVKARNWREMIQMAVAAGALSQGIGDQIENALGMLAGLSGNPKTLDVPLDFRRGLIFLGPLPVGTAPIVRLR
ncbi:DUF2125 domain-containing protein [Thalassovita taeanensis]|uniref:DUF2125 domain-containing protein n=1 Tax=Thalassovita taeanensis TaxID=657014 RepID=UPI001FE4C280|nr:DUF2125 domain-containing protein [Thalassovita taeanensis]